MQVYTDLPRIASNLLIVVALMNNVSMTMPALCSRTWNIVVAMRYHHNNLFRIVAFMKRCSPHDDVIKWKHFPRYWPFVRGNHRSPVNSPHKGQWRGALMFSLICAWTKGWVNNRNACNLRRHHAHYDVTVMWSTVLRRRHMHAGVASCLPYMYHLTVCWKAIQADNGETDKVLHY